MPTVPNSPGPITNTTAATTTSEATAIAGQSSPPSTHTPARAISQPSIGLDRDQRPQPSGTFTTLPGQLAQARNRDSTSPSPTTMSTPAPAQPNAPPPPPFPFPSIPPPPVMPTSPPVPPPSPPAPQPEPPKPPTNSPQPQPQPQPGPSTAPPQPPSSSPSPLPPVTVIVTSVDTHIIATIVTSTLVRVTNTADGSSTSTLMGIDSQGSLIPIPTGQTMSAGDKVAASSSPSVSGAVAGGDTSSAGLSNSMLAMVVVIPIVVLFFIAIAVTLLKRRSDLKRYQDGIATQPRRLQPQPQPQGDGTRQDPMGQEGTGNGATGDAAASTPLISITNPVHQFTEQQGYAPVPQPNRSPLPMEATDPANVYLDPAPSGGYYQSHPPPSPTASTSTRGSLFVAPGPPRVVDPNVPMLAPASGHAAGGPRSSIPHRASKLRYSTADQDATDSLVPGMDEGVQFSKTPKAQTSRLS